MKLTQILFSLVFLALFSFSQSMSINAHPSSSNIDQGTVTTLSASVQAIGGGASDVSLSITLPSGLSTSDASTVSVGTLNFGQISSTKSWVIKGNEIGAYDIVVTASSSSAGTQQSTIHLDVISAGFIVSSVEQSPPSTAALNSEFTLQFTLKNIGTQSISSVIAAPSYSSGINMTSGIVMPFDGFPTKQQVVIIWKFKVTTYGSHTVSAVLTTSSNDPADLEYTVTVPAPGTASAYPSTTPTPTASATPSASASPSASPTPTASATPTPSLFSRGLDINNATNTSTFTLSITNNGNSTITDNVTDTIPKSVAGNVSELDFNPEPTQIIQADPVVAWTLTLAPKETKTISYSVKKIVNQSVLNEFSAPTIQLVTATPTASATPTAIVSATPSTYATATPSTIPTQSKGMDYTLPVILLVLIGAGGAYFYFTKK